MLPKDTMSSLLSGTLYTEDGAEIGKISHISCDPLMTDDDAPRVAQDYSCELSVALPKKAYRIFIRRLYRQQFGRLWILWWVYHKGLIHAWRHLPRQS